MLANGFDADDARELLLEHDADARVLVVGHEPSFSQVVHDLTGGRLDFKKGGVAAVRLQPGGGELIVLLRPRELESLGALGGDRDGLSASTRSSTRHSAATTAGRTARPRGGAARRARTPGRAPCGTGGRRSSPRTRRRRG